jgi:sugar phosphate isomerase/epimerase
MLRKAIPTAIRITHLHLMEVILGQRKPPLAGPPIEQLQGMCAIVSRFIVTRRVRQPIRAEARAAEAEVLGWRRLVIGWVNPANLDDATLARIAEAAAAAAARGLELGYHNHDAEIEQGFLERLPAGVFLELDAGWAWYAGADPIAFLGRGPLLHVKDFRERGEPSFCPVGDGAVGFESIVPEAVRDGVEWLIVEQDEPVGTEIDDARRSLAAVTTMLGEVA